jgi:hypothetical protein
MAAKGEQIWPLPVGDNDRFALDQGRAALDHAVLDDRFHETGIEKPTSMELEGCW